MIDGIETRGRSVVAITARHRVAAAGMEGDAAQPDLMASAAATAPVVEGGRR